MVAAHAGVGQQRGQVQAGADDKRVAGGCRRVMSGCPLEGDQQPVSVCGQLVSVSDQRVSLCGQLVLGR